MTSHRALLIILGILAASSALCAPTPHSYIDGTPQTKTDTHLHPIDIVAVDGDAPHTKPVAVTPGPHWLEIQAVQGAGIGSSRTQTFVLKIEPCTYYYLGARKDSDGSDKWKLVVDEEDTLKECDPAAELKKAKDHQPVPPAASKSHASR